MNPEEEKKNYEIQKGSTTGTSYILVSIARARD
jgi:hypothetical protein